MSQENSRQSFADLNPSQEGLLKEMEKKLNMEAGEEIILLAYKKKSN